MSNERNILDVLTMDEIEIIEQMTGKEMNQLFGSGNLSAKASKAMVWLLMKRTNPNADIAEAGKMTTVQVTQFIKDFVADPKVQY